MIAHIILKSIELAIQFVGVIVDIFKKDKP